MPKKLSKPCYKEKSMFKIKAKEFFLRKKYPNKKFAQIEEKMFLSLANFIKKSKRKDVSFDEMVIEKMRRGEKVEISEQLNKFFELFALKNRLRKETYKNLRIKYIRPVAILTPTQHCNFSFYFISSTEKETQKFNGIIKEILTKEGLRPYHACGAHKDFGENFPGMHVWEVWPSEKAKEKINVNYLFDLATKIGDIFNE